MADPIGVGTQCALAWLLVFSGVSKASDPSTVRRTLTGLRVPQSLVIAVTTLVICVEWILGAAVVVWPRGSVVQLALLLLFGLFAVTGIYAISTGKKIECACLGPLHAGGLGWTQIVQFPVAVAGVFVIARQAQQFNLSTSIALLISVHLATAVVLLALAGAPWHRVRSQRVSLGHSEGLRFIAQQSGA